MANVAHTIAKGVLPTEAKLVNYLLLKHGPLSTLQLLDLYPESGSAWELKWRILQPLRHQGTISYKWYRAPDNLQRAMFLWTLPWAHERPVWQAAAERRLHDLEAKGDTATLDAERLEHKLIPKKRPTDPSVH